MLYFHLNYGIYPKQNQNTCESCHRKLNLSLKITSLSLKTQLRSSLVEPLNLQRRNSVLVKDLRIVWSRNEADSLRFPVCRSCKNPLQVSFVKVRAALLSKYQSLLFVWTVGGQEEDLKPSYNHVGA